VGIKPRFSLISLALIFVCGLMLMIFFLFHWSRGQRSLEELSIEEVRLQKELAQLQHYHKWTDDYWRIYKALEFLSVRKMPERERCQLAEQIWMISRNYNFDPLLILAIVSQESHGNPKARGRVRSGEESGAYGLMQLKLETAQRLGRRFGMHIESEDDLMRPEINIAIGSAYLMRLIGRYGDLQKAIMAYNVGPGALDSRLENNQAPPTRYYEAVLSKYQKLVEALNHRSKEGT
jgi:soluble lytic murein transglycosylase-like protein